MAIKSCSDEEFMALFSQHGASGTARILGQDVRPVHKRRRRLEAVYALTLVNPNPDPGNNYNQQQKIGHYPKRLHAEVKNGVVMIGSDAHYWPGEISTAHRGFVKLIERLKPEMIILNGDVLDGASISRHPPIQWENKPSLVNELTACDERLDEIRAVSGNAKLHWTMGNHDARFENKLSGQAPEYKDVEGTRLSDHFPHWTFSFSVWINNHSVVKHRFKGGIHATHNNTLWSGKNIFTGHLHSLKVTPFDDYNGTRFGGDSGTLSNPYGDHTGYTEDNPLNHRGGFLVLTFIEGKILWPEIAAVVDADHIQFRGEIIKVT